MDCGKVGKLILNLRKEKNMTQKELADAMNISDRTVSKWERGAGCPDVSLLNELSKILGVNIEKILIGDLEINGKNGGNIKKIKFYVCSDCGNVLFSFGEAAISCCGRKLSILDNNAANKGHSAVIEEIENDYFVTLDHEMTKTHYISFVAFAGYDRVVLIKLYPEQNAELRIPKTQGGKLYAYCTKHGLSEINISR